MFLLEMLMVDGDGSSFVFFVMDDLDWFDGPENASAPGDSRSRARRVLFVAGIL